MVMLRKTVIALLAVVSVGLAAPTMALARGGGGGGGGGGGHGGGVVVAMASALVVAEAVSTAAWV
jgi:hypothetical protein